ncbi:MAG: GNAT family N-acetyltransferase, partial [Pyrinomonadaceae bacterium]|nr:GNAT family N-acetyltransferase [Phycisphaerales bacterium]
GQPRSAGHTQPDIPTHILQQEALVRHACHHLRGMKTPPVSRGVSRRVTPLAGDRANARVVALVQGLLEPHELDAIEALGRAGFMRLGDLAYMRRSLPRANGGRGAHRLRLSRPSRAGAHAAFGEAFVWPAGVVVRRLSDISNNEHDALLAAALERSYIDTQDCPELCGLREVADVLDSHRSVGDFDPALWWIIEYEGKPEGAMLLSACPEQQTVELVYLGISPVLRGKGIGSAMLAMGLKELTGRDEATISCAVDMRNGPAMKLYTRAGFQEFSTRVPMVMGIR